jgi:glutathione S-transferase
MNRPVLITGAIGSPYTRKMRALARYRRIPYRFLAMQSEEAASLPKPPLPLLPGVYLPEDGDGYTATSDSTFQLRALEERYAGRSVIPSDPALAFLDYLVEDYADEWVTKLMFYYRWGIPADCENASNMLPLWNLTVSDSAVEEFRTTFAVRQVDRLSGVVTGSLEACGPILEASYGRLLEILRAHFTTHRFVFGARPSAGDFALHGQLTQLVQVEPTPMALARAQAPRVLAWVDVVEDLGGIEVTDADWTPRDALAETFRELLGELGRTYAPFLVANAAAIDSGEAETHCEIDGQKYWQKAFPYQRKCLGWIHEEYARLESGDRALVDGALSDTGCEVLVPGT